MYKPLINVDNKNCSSNSALLALTIPFFTCNVFCVIKDHVNQCNISDSRMMDFE